MFDSPSECLIESIGYLVLMRLYFPDDLTDKVSMIEELALGGI